MPQKHHIIDLDPYIGHVPGTPLPADPPPKHVSVKNQDTVTWECSQDFVVLNVHPQPADPTKPDNPFYRQLPFNGTRKNVNEKFRANSGPPVPGAVVQLYKSVFHILGDPAPIDPHFIVED